jgi:hypothetical protein
MPKAAAAAAAAANPIIRRIDYSLWSGGTIGGKCLVSITDRSGRSALASMIPKSGYRFSEKIMLQQQAGSARA